MGSEPAGALTLGVEEEYLLVDAGDRRPVPVASAVRKVVLADLELDVHRELSASQVEFASGVCTDLGVLHAEVLQARRILDAVATRSGARLLASGTPPLGRPGPPPLTDVPRYHRMMAEYGPVAEEQGVCACHVHVGVPSQEHAVQASNHLRRWLPALLALTANSPFFDGRDTGHVSWRTMMRSMWPVCGVPPYFADADAYRALIDTLIETGVILDVGMVYWHIRPSARVPTVEIRIADVAVTAAEAALLAGLVRALVTQALAEFEAGRPAPEPQDEMLRAACWRAAAVGLNGRCLDPFTGGPATGWALVSALLRQVRPALEDSGDFPFITRAIAWLRANGCGASRQRAAFRRDGALERVVDFIVDQAQLDLFA